MRNLMAKIRQILSSGMTPLLIILLCFTACPSKRAPSPESPAATKPPPPESRGPVSRKKPIEIVVSTTILGEVAKRMGGSRVHVHSLVEPGISPLTYNADDEDATLLENAEIIFINGLGLEPGLMKLLEEYNGEAEIVDVSQSIDKNKLLASTDYRSGYDPHYWFDPDIWQDVIAFITLKLFTMDPGYEFGYQSNHIRYGKSMSHLKRYIKKEAYKIPEERRVLITENPVFGYFARDYGFKVLSLTDTTGVDSGNMNELRDYIIENKIPALFGEWTFPGEPVKTLEQAVRDRGGTVTNGGSLYTYTWGPPETLDRYYLVAVRKNIDMICQALNGE